jgi:hypothetical protein
LPRWLPVALGAALMAVILVFVAWPGRSDDSGRDATTPPTSVPDGGLRTQAAAARVSDGGEAQPAVAASPEPDISCDLAVATCEYDPAVYSCEEKHDGPRCTHRQDREAKVEVKAKDDGKLEVKLKAAERLACTNDSTTLSCRYVGEEAPTDAEVLTEVDVACSAEPERIDCLTRADSSLPCTAELEKVRCFPADGSKLEFKANKAGLLELTFDPRAVSCGRSADGRVACRSELGPVEVVACEAEAGEVVLCRSGGIVAHAVADDVELTCEAEELKKVHCSTEDGERLLRGDVKDGRFEVEYAPARLRCESTAERITCRVTTEVTSIEGETLVLAALTSTGLEARELDPDCRVEDDKKVRCSLSTGRLEVKAKNSNLVVVHPAGAAACGRVGGAEATEIRCVRR